MPLTKGIVVSFMLRNSITEVDQYLANVKFCLAPFCLHLSRADGSVPFPCSSVALYLGPGSAIPETLSFRELYFLFEVASSAPPTSESAPA